MKRIQVLVCDTEPKCSRGTWGHACCQGQNEVGCLLSSNFRPCCHRTGMEACVFNPRAQRMTEEFSQKYSEELLELEVSLSCTVSSRTTWATDCPDG